MNITKAITLCLVLAATTAVVSGQAAYILRGAGSGGPLETEGFYLPSAQYPHSADRTSPFVPRFHLPHFHSGATPPVGDTGQGGHTINQDTNRMLSTDGWKLWEEPHRRYPDPSFTPLPEVPVSLTGFGAAPIMGIGMDAGHDILWMCNAFAFQPFSSTYPYPAVGPVVFPSFDPNGFTGIAYEPSSQSLWLCNYVGDVMNCGVGGSLISLKGRWNNLQGIAVNTTNGIGSFPPPSCSAQDGGFHIIATSGGAMVDGESGDYYLLPSPRNCYGLAFSADGQYSEGGNAPALRFRIERPFNRDAGPIATNLTGAAAGAWAFLLYDVCPMTPGLPLAGGLIRVNAGYIPMLTDAAGNASFDLPAFLLPAGFQLTTQWAVWNGGFDLTNAMTLTVGLR